MNSKKWTIAALVVVAVIGIFLTGRYTAPKAEFQAGTTPGGNYIENYVPAILYNGGIASALPIQTTSDLTVGGVLNLTGSFTSTSGTTTTGTSGVPDCAIKGGYDVCVVQQSFTAATNTPIIIRSPFGSSATTTFNPILVQITTGGPAITFDLATTSLSNFATTSLVLAKNISVGNSNTYTGLFAPLTATSTAAGVIQVTTAGVLPGNTALGESTWFLRPGEGLMLKIASTSVSGSVTGTVTVEMSKP